MRDKRTTIAEAVTLVEDGATLGIASPAVQPTALISMAAVREIVRQGKRDLTVINAMAELESDMLAGAGCVRAIQFWACQFFGMGTPPNIRRGMQAGEIIAREESEFSFTLGVLAGGMGVEFIPLHGYFNDHLPHHPEWRTFPSPFDGKQLLAVTAVVPDVAADPRPPGRQVRQRAVRRDQPPQHGGQVPRAAHGAGPRSGSS